VLAWFTEAGHPHWPGAPFVISILFTAITLILLARTPRRKPSAISPL
jgi:hypothetical protein